VNEQTDELKSLNDVLEGEAARGKRSAEDVARDVVDQLLLRRSRRTWQGRVRQAAPLAAIAIAASIFLVATRARSHDGHTTTGTCAQTAYTAHGATDMITFCDGSPAVGTELDHNFDRLFDYIDARGGDNITLGPLTVKGGTMTLVSSASGNGGRALVADGTTLTINKSGEYAGGVTIGGSQLVQFPALTITGTVTAAGMFAGTGTATTASRSDHYHDPTCPFNTASGYKTAVIKGNSRLCVYELTGTMIDYATAASSCWSTYEAPLCSVAELALVRNIGTASGGMSANSTSLWLRDRTDDNEAMITDANASTNFEAHFPSFALLGGGYCCRMLRRP
jgi:hypothetical protein